MRRIPMSSPTCPPAHASGRGWLGLYVSLTLELALAFLALALCLVKQL